MQKNKKRSSRWKRNSSLRGTSPRNREFYHNWHEILSCSYSFTNHLDRRQVNIPHDRACQWTFFCFVVFNSVKEKVCRNSMSKLCAVVSEHYDFKMTPAHARIISNIFIKNYCRERTPRTFKESKLKVLKLSEDLWSHTMNIHYF